MEINANIYIITDSQELMEKIEAILSRETDALFDWETIDPHPILPLVCENALLCSRSAAQSSCASGVPIIRMTIANTPTRPPEEM